MIPYIDPPILALGSVRIHAFGLALGAAVWTGIVLLPYRARRQGLDPATARAAVPWLLAGGFLGAHLFATLLYSPRAVALDPWMLARPWESLASSGAMVGGLAAVLLFLRRRVTGSDRRWAYLDVVAFAFALSFMIGRAGCALAHDHPGSITRFPLGLSLETQAARDLIVQAYASAGQLETVPIPSVLAGLAFHDVGLYEFAFLALVVVPTVVLLGRRARPAGSFVTAFLLLYLPFRFGIDFLRVTDPRYLGLTPAQWLAAAGVALLSILLVRRRSARAPVASAPASGHAATRHPGP